MTKKLVELHGGTIAAVSEGEGRGSTFTVRLPLMTEARVAAARLRDLSAPNEIDSTVAGSDSSTDRPSGEGA
ncbi:MAG: hypothetical protein KGJ40_08525 [candidate division NC10 bacterium]|nr:hypothetical protein [candidate division NC10 bacterium]